MRVRERERERERLRESERATQKISTCSATKIQPHCEAVTHTRDHHIHDIQSSCPTLTLSHGQEQESHRPRGSATTTVSR